MDIREHDFLPGAPEPSARALGVITAIVIIAGLAVVAASLALLLIHDWRNAPVERSTVSACRICGVVERVSDVPPASLQQLEGSRAEGTVMLLAALGGATASALPAKIYFTSVLHDDGSVRILQDTSVPPWKAGDRVKVIKGRVAQDASQTERTAIPAPPAGRGW
jgi:hypothetical protein